MAEPEDELLSRYSSPSSPSLRYSGPDVPLPYPEPQRPMGALNSYIDSIRADDVVTPMIFDMLLGKGSAPPWPPKKATPELRSHPDSVLPSHEFWNKYITDNPAWQDKIGSTQAAAISGLNALGFGVPMAALRRVAPDAAERVDAVTRAHSKPAMAADVAATVANPANKLFRTAGNALARKGYGLMSQAGADAGSAAALYGLPGIATYGDVSGGVGYMPLAAAMRIAMPRLPDGVLARMGYGAGMGALTGVAQMPSNQFSPFYSVPAGALHGAMMRRPRPRNDDVGVPWGARADRESLMDALKMSGTLGALGTSAQIFWPSDGRKPSPIRDYDD